MKNVLLLVLLVLLCIPAYCQDSHNSNDLFDITHESKKSKDGKLIWITDIGLAYRINSIPQRSITFPEFNDVDTKDMRGQFYIISDVGAVKKLKENIGLGVSHFIGVDLIEDGGFRNGIKLKYRQWFKNGSFFDISPGITLLNHGFKSPGFISSIDWWKNEYYGFTLLFEYLPKKKDTVEYGIDESGKEILWETKEYKKDFGIYLGIKTGSKYGLISNGVLYGISLIGIAVAIAMGGL